LALSAAGLTGCVYVPNAAGGMLCELHPAYRAEPPAPGRAPADFSRVPPGWPTTGPVLVYLDVWGRPVAIVEDPALQQPALGGPDTGARTRTIVLCAYAPMPLYPCAWCN
jgi:hypothetical protein